MYHLVIRELEVKMKITSPEEQKKIILEDQQPSNYKRSLDILKKVIPLEKNKHTL